MPAADLDWNDLDKTDYHKTGFSISWRCAMSKKPYGVLILHGFTASLDCICEIEPPLKALGVPIRMPVLRGHNTSSPEALQSVTWHEWLSDAKTALQDLLNEAEKAILIGHSMGGLLALILAAKYKENIDSIILAAAAVQMASPLAPGRPLNFLAPMLALVVKKWNFPPVYADPSLAKYNTNYLWAPTGALLSVLELSKTTRKVLSEVSTPTLILQSRNDSTVVLENAEIILNEISTPAELKQVIWFDKTEHEMFRDCERNAIIAVITNYVKERIVA